MKKNSVMVKQPMPKYDHDNFYIIPERSSLPIFSKWIASAITRIWKNGVSFLEFSIKLIKCTWMFEARKTLNLAEALGIKVMIGWMTEISRVIYIASQLSAGLDFADIDNALLIANDCFVGTKLERGKITASNLLSISVKFMQGINYGI